MDTFFTEPHKCEAVVKYFSVSFSHLVGKCKQENKLLNNMGRVLVVLFSLAVSCPGWWGYSL